LWRTAASAQETVSPRASETVKAAAAQDAESAGPSSRRVEEAKPSLYYLKDKQGNLQPVPNFTFEDFEELYRLKHQLVQADQRPRYSIQQISASGIVAGGQAELTIQFRILVREAEWVRVPLHLDQAMLREQPKYEGPGEHFVHFEGDNEGYVAWIHGPAGGQHQLTLKMLLPLGSVGEETRLKLLAPRATASELKLTVPVSGAVAKVSEGATLLPPTVGKTETEFTVLGLSGDFELTWYKPGARVADMPAVLEAVGAVAARIDSRGVNSEATLSVKSYGAAFDRFRVRLPQGAELVADGVAGYSVVPVEQNDKAAPQQRLVEVRLAKKTSGPVEVRLSAARTCDPAAPGQWSELAGFEVVGAARQWGSLAVTVIGDWQILWGPSRGVRQIDQLPESLRRKDVTAGFDYFAQPYSLTARLVPKKTRINVEPEYLLFVDADQVRLEAKLKYTVRGAKTFALEVALPDWELDEVGPDNLVAVDGVATAGSSVYSIPLLQPSSGQFEIHIRAHRRIPPDGKSLLLALPQPQASAPGSAIVAVLPADNVELIPNDRAMVGLVRQQVAPPLELPPRQQEPLFYRNEASKAVFAADVRRHARRISVDVASQLDLDEEGGSVEQQLAYVVAYEPVDHFLLDVPRSLAGSGRLELLENGEPVAAAPAAEGDDNPAGPLRMKVALPKPCIGSCRLTARWQLAGQKPAAADRKMLTVPLVMPAEGDLSGNKLSVKAAAGMRVEAGPGPWTEADSNVLRPLRGPRLLELTAAKRTPQVDLVVRWESGGAAIVVEREWVQTWLTSTARQDRAAFQFTSNRKELELFLPAGVAHDQISARLDGKRVAVQVGSDGSLTIPLAGAPEQGRRLLELRYQLAERPSRGAMTLELPQLGRDAWVQRMYWQLVLPRDEHVLASPQGFAGEHAWAWSGYFWGRQPLMDQEKLESWVGAPHRDSVPADANEYLFSAFGHIQQGELYTAGRSWIVMLASGIALLAGLVLIYVPLTRHPAALLVAVALLLAVGLIYPEPAWLAAQAATLGLLLALLAAVLAGGISRQRQKFGIPEMASAARESVLTTASRPLPAGGSTSTQSIRAVVIPPPADTAP
jgi:hypothetical protein